MLHTLLVAAALTVAAPRIGSPAPEFALTTIDGKRVRLADYRGKVLVLNVWGSWCPPCRAETADLVAEAKRLAGKVAFLGVDTTESAAVVRAFVAAKGVPFPQAVVAQDGAFARAYAIHAFPSTFVIDRAGIVRAVHLDNVLPRAQLQAYVGAAERGQSAAVATPFQRELDAQLDPARFAFAGDSATVRAAVRHAGATIAKVTALLDDAMEDPARDHDVARTQTEEERLRAAAIAAFSPLAASDDDRALLARLRGDEAAWGNDWAAADAAYAEAVRLDPTDTAALAGEAAAAARRGDRERAAALAADLAKLQPGPDTFVALGRAQARLGRITDAETAFARARELAAGQPRLLAWSNLYEGRMETAAGNPVKARAAFARAAQAASAIPAADPHRDWYVEQAQEGDVALGIARGAAPALSLAPWTGPDLPGSIASTYKYRLVVTGSPGARIALRAGGLPPRWIASFCSDRVCSPFRTALVVPAGGVKIVELQVVPWTPAAHPARVRVEAVTGGRLVARADAALPA